MKHFYESVREDVTRMPIFYSIGKGQFSMDNFLKFTTWDLKIEKYELANTVDDIAFKLIKKDDDDNDEVFTIIVVDVNNQPHQLIKQVAKDIHCNKIVTSKFLTTKYEIDSFQGPCAKNDCESTGGSKRRRQAISSGRFVKRRRKQN